MNLATLKTRLNQIVNGTTISSGSLTDLLTKLGSDVKTSYDAVESKDGVLPENKNAEELPPAIETIEAQ